MIKPVALEIATNVTPITRNQTGLELKLQPKPSLKTDSMREANCKHALEIGRRTVFPNLVFDKGGRDQRDELGAAPQAGEAFHAPWVVAE